MPFINVRSKLPGLGRIVQGFNDRGYVLADDNMTPFDDEIDGIDFILGSVSAYCLPHSEVLFGLEKLSVYFQTSVGVLISGNIDQMLEDLQYLPHKNACCCYSNQNSLDLTKSLLAEKSTCLVSDLSLEDSLLPNDFSVLNDKGEVVESQLEKAANEVLEFNCSCYIHLDNNRLQENSQLNDKLVKYDVSNITRNEEGRLVVPLLWNVLIFINNLKRKICNKCPNKFSNLDVLDDNQNFFAEASRRLLVLNQSIHYPEVLKYFNSGNRLLKDIPKVVGQLNVYSDGEGLLRVHSKLDRLKEGKRYRFPILLSKESPLTKLIILDYHDRFAHAGCYSLLSEIRKVFWIPRYFSVVKQVIKSCVVCRRFNESTIKLNQNPYRDFRVNPPEIPYRYIFMDYLGPYNVRSNGQKVKVWLSCITCTWSRAINLKLCVDLTVKEFLRSFQLHCYEFGLPELCISDMGTQLVAGANTVLDFLKDPEVKLYFEENGVQPIKFEHYFKGNSTLGSMVESCVKLTKRLLYGCIKNNVLDLRDFEFLVFQVVHLVNRRPIAFKEALSEADLTNSFPDPITPESLIHGYDLISVNIIPDLQRSPYLDDENFSAEPSDKVRGNYKMLQKVRSNLIDLYHEEFLTNLIHQAVSVKDRYRPVKHTALKKNDIVLIKGPFCKPSQYPMGIVQEVVENNLGEVTGVTLLKGKTHDITKRHVSNLIFLLRPDVVSEPDPSNPTDIQTPKSPTRCPRKAARKSREKTRRILQES